MVVSKKEKIVTTSGGAPSSSSGGRSTPKVSARRVSRFAVSTSFTAPKVQRPPIVLEWGTVVIRVGYAEKFQPQHILPLPPPPGSNGSGATAANTTPSQWYDYVAPIVSQIFDLLMVDPTVHRVVCVTRPYPPKAWEEALQFALWNVGVPAYSLTSFLDVVPMALGWLRGMVIHVDMEEAHCLAHVDGHALHFTYQVVPCGYKSVTEQRDDLTTKVRTQWSSNMEYGWLNENNPNSLLVAVIKCLEACPRDIRMDIISNLLFCGETLLAVPDLPRRVGLRLKKICQGEATGAATVTTASATSSIADAGEEKSGDDDDGDKEVKDAVVSLDALTLVGDSSSSPSLKPLADHVGLISCAPYRADLICWVGASVWSTIWHRQSNTNAKNEIPWVFSPSKQQQEEQSKA